MANAAGNRNRLSYAVESVWGTDPAGNYNILRKLGDAGITLDRTQLRTAEWNDRRAVTGFRLGNKNVGVNVPFELSYATYDDLIASAFFSDWVTAPAANSSLTVTVIASSTRTMGATGIGTGIAVGDWVKIAGFASPLTANNGFYKVSARTDDLLTFASATNLVAGTSAGATVSSQGMEYILPGTTRKSLAFCESQLDIAAYTQALGAIADSMSLSVQPDAIITGSFGFLAKTFTGPQGTTFGGTEVAANSNEVMQSNDTYTKLWLDNAAAPTCAVTAFDFALANGGNRVMPAFCDSPNVITADDAVFTGNMTMLQEDYSMLTKYLAETTMALTSRILDLNGTQGYAIEFPKIKLTSHAPQRGKSNTPITMAWSALEYSSTFNACKIWRLV